MGFGSGERAGLCSQGCAQRGDTLGPSHCPAPHGRSPGPPPRGPGCVRVPALHGAGAELSSILRFAFQQGQKRTPGLEEPEGAGPGSLKDGRLGSSHPPLGEGASSRVGGAPPARATPCPPSGPRARSSIHSLRLLEPSGGPKTQTESMNGKREEKQRPFPLPASPPPPRLPPGRASPARSDRGRGGGTAGAAAEGSSLAGDSAIYKLWSSRIKRAERSPLLLEPRSLAGPLPSDFDFITPPPPPAGGLAGAGVGAVSARAALPKVRLLTSERPLLSMNGSGSLGTVWQRGYRRHRLLLDAGGGGGGGVSEQQLRLKGKLSKFQAARESRSREHMRPKARCARADRLAHSRAHTQTHTHTRT